MCLACCWPKVTVDVGKGRIQSLTKTSVSHRNVTVNKDFPVSYIVVKSMPNNSFNCCDRIQDCGFQ